MSKVNIKYVVKNINSKEVRSKELKAIKTKNKITYKEEEMNVSIELSDIIKITRKDMHKEIILEYKEKENTIGLYKIYNNAYKLNIYTNKLEIKDNYIEIDYIIEDDNINFKLYIK